MTHATVTNLHDHMALTCRCGSVNFALLRSGGIECNKCSTPQRLLWAENEDTSDCRDCGGSGKRDVWRAVTGHYLGGETFREDCETCEGKGWTA